MKPTVKVTPASLGANQFISAKVTAALLILIDAAVIWVISSNGSSGLKDMPFWTICIVLWSISLIVAFLGIVTNRTMLFMPCYIVWCATCICSVLFMIVDAYANAYCDREPHNRTSRWISPCETYFKNHNPYSSYVLLLLLKLVQLFHTKSLAAAIDSKMRDDKGENSVFCLGSVSREAQPFLYWIFGGGRTKVSTSSQRKEAESDDDDMVVFEKIAGAFKGDRPKINDMGRASIS